jgi:hypothetical protein
MTSLPVQLQRECAGAATAAYARGHRYVARANGPQLRIVVGPQRIHKRQADRAQKLKDRLRAKIDRTRALTIAGLAAKAQVAAIEGEDDTQFADTTLASILRDMRALAKIAA